MSLFFLYFFFFQAEDGIRDKLVTGVQTCALPILKSAVRFLEPFMEKKGGATAKGTLVLATVKGDVHDIGKNLVDIILTNNGYRVVNLGIKQTIESIIQAFEEHEADAIGMSGLLVKSTLVMRDNLEILNERGISAPV